VLRLREVRPERPAAEQPDSLITQRLAVNSGKPARFSHPDPVIDSATDYHGVELRYIADFFDLLVPRSKATALKLIADHLRDLLSRAMLTGRCN
jgi:hypothetical protein